MATAKAPVSIGELLDRLTIADIKSNRLRSELAFYEYRQLFSALCDFFNRPFIGPVPFEKIAKEVPELGGEKEKTLLELLRYTNESLWDKENALQRFRAADVFDTIVVTLSYSIREENNLRSKIKQALNAAFLSDLPELKSYR